MWEQDWALLGIEPTTELAAIKKAYALKLRTTRPDDDAQAYQALRGAYERVQQWLKWQRDEAAAQADVVAPPPTPPVPVTAPPALDEPTEHVVQPRHLIDELELRWRRSGEPALMHGWAEVRRELGQQPLSRQAEFSVAFAHWVLNLQNLPDEFLKALDAHFGWLNDFRTERQLGPALAQALHEALDGRLRPRAVDPAVLALAAPLRWLQSLRSSGGNAWKLSWLFFLLQPLIARNQILLGPEWLRQLGLDLEAQRWLKDGVKQGVWARVGLVAALVFAAGVAMFNDAVIAGGHTVTWFFMTTLVLFGGLFAGAFVNGGPTLTTPKRRWALPLDIWRRGQMQPLLALVWLLFAAWLAYLDAATDANPTPGGLLSVLPPWAYGWASMGFAVSGLFVAWPLDGLRGCVVGGLAALVGYLATQALNAWLPPVSCVLLGAAWMLWAAAVHEGRLPAPTPVRWLLRPMLNSFALADRWTYSMAVMPLAACSAWAVLNDGAASPLRLFMIWMLAILLVAWLQGKAEAWGLRRMPAADAAA